MKRKLGALEKVDADLPNLQHKIRRDPMSYGEDFTNQYAQYRTLLELFRSSPTTTDDNGVVRIRDLIDFVSHVADCYPDMTKEFSSDLIALLEVHHATLDAELRDKIVGSLVLLRKKELLSSAALLNVLFPLLVSTPSKTLRQLLFEKIISVTRTDNSKVTNHKLNRTLQQACYDLVSSDSSSPKGLWSVKITRALWKKRVWTDAKSVSIMEIAALSQDAKVVAGGVRFFLGGDQEREEAAAEEDSDDEGHVDIAKLKHQAGINKKSNKKSKEIREAAKKIKKKQKRKKAPHPLNFSALHLLNDPQGFAEKLFAQHLQPTNPKVRLNLDQKLLVLQLVTRLVGLHKLTLIPLYSYFLKYLTPRQPNVTSFLASLAQSTHNLVPPDTLEPLVQKIANEFVSEAAASEVCSAGLNGIREICVRQPLCMNETLLQDLVEYRKSKDKGVQMAARGLLSLYREVGAEMLRKRDRGKDAALAMRDPKKTQQLLQRRFGEVEEGGIEGLDLLEKWKEEQRAEKGVASGEEDVQAEEAAGWDNWDAESDGSDSSGGWINVESDGEDIDISDSEAEKDNKKAIVEKKVTAEKRKLHDVEDGVEQQHKPEAPESNKENTAASPASPLTSRNTASLEPAEAVKREEARMSKLATTRILTPADLAKLHDLRTSAAITASMPSAKRRKLQAAAQHTQRHADDALTADHISGLSALGHKATKEEKVALAKGRRPGEDVEGNDHRSTTARRKEKKAAEGKSTTNREKARKKNFLMTLGKAKRKGKRSLVEHRKVLRAHVERGKRGGRRGNK